MDYVVVGKNDDNLAHNLALRIGCNYFDFESRYHPDGSPHPATAADYEAIEGKDVILLSRRKQWPSRHEFARHTTNLLLVALAIKDPSVFNARSLSVCLPYYLFGRQDHNPRTDSDYIARERDAGEPVAYRFFPKALQGIGGDDIVTINPHFHRDVGLMYEGEFPIHCLSAIGKLANHARDRLDPDAKIISPDGSATSMGETFAGLVDRELVVFDDKHRQDAKNVSYDNVAHDFEGCDVAIVDDEVNTLGTVKRTIEDKIKNPGYIDVYAVHGVLPEDGFKRATAFTRTEGSIRRLVTTDSIANQWGTVEVIDVLVEHYKKRDSRLRGVSPEGAVQAV